MNASWARIVQDLHQVLGFTLTTLTSAQLCKEERGCIHLTLFAHESGLQR